MQILLVNQTFHPDTSATSYYCTDVASKLAQNGHKVTVLTAARGYSSPYPRFPAKELYGGITIRRVWPITFGRESRLGRLLDACCLNLAFAFRLFCLPRFDRVVALTSPPLIGWITSLWAAIKKVKFIYWIMDVNPDEAVQVGWIKKDSLISYALENTLKITLRRSHRIVCLDSFMKDRIARKAPREAHIDIVPAWSLDNDLQTLPHAANAFRTRHDLQDFFVVMYAGNHSICHPLDTLLEAAWLLRDARQIKFVFVGNGNRVSDVTQYKDKKNLFNIVQIPHHPRDKMKYCLSSADLHVVVMGDGYAGIVHPCKIYGILAIGRPFVYIGPEESHITQIMRDHKVGYEVRHGQAEELAETIKAAMRLGESEKESIMRSEKAAAQRFSQQILCNQLADIITSE